jgi:tetratricopeptide (TPR) repeat protein
MEKLSDASKQCRDNIDQFIRERNYKAAIEECERYFRVSGEEEESLRAAVQQYYGYCFLQIGDPKRACRELEKSLRMKADNHIKHLAYFNLGNAYESMKKKEEARRYYKESLEYAETENDRRIVRTFISVLSGK